DLCHTDKELQLNASAPALPTLQPGFFLSLEPHPSCSRTLLMRLSIFSTPGSPPAFACRIAFAVEGEIFVNSGLTYRFFDCDLEAVEAVFALDGESMTSLF